MSGRNVRWPRRMLPLMSHGEYDDGTDRRTDARPLHYMYTLTAKRDQCYNRYTAVKQLAD